MKHFELVIAKEDIKVISASLGSRKLAYVELRASERVNLLDESVHRCVMYTSIVSAVGIGVGFKN